MGREILDCQKEEGWGAKVIERLAKDLKQEFPGVRGFSRSNLLYMRAFAEAYPHQQIVQEVLGQIPWYHNIALLDKLKDPQHHHLNLRQLRPHLRPGPEHLKVVPIRLFNSAKYCSVLIESATNR